MCKENTLNKKGETNPYFSSKTSNVIINSKNTHMYVKKKKPYMKTYEFVIH